MKEVRIITGIVLFNPEMNRLKENVDAIYKKTQQIVFIDNGSDNIKQTEELLSSYEGIKIIRNDTNLGIARALNQICEYAMDNGADYVLTLDQDSVCPDSIIDEYKKYISDKSGIICPVIKDRNHNLNQVSGVEDVTEIEKCITSASLLNLQAWESVNGFDESMFIDGVDFDICMRIRKKGYSIFRVNSVVLIHEIGRITVRRFLLWKVMVKNHSAFRKYYIARNTVYLARKQGSAKKIAKSFFQVAKQWLCVLFYESEKKNKLVKIQKGFFDGLKTKLVEKWK